MDARLLRGLFVGSLFALGGCKGAAEPATDDGMGGGAGAPLVEAGAGASGGSGGGSTSDPNDLHACTGPGQCILVEAARDCCVARCGEEPLSFFDAIHVDHLPAWHAGQTCAGCLEPCGAEGTQAFIQSTRTFVAACEDGRCRPVDIREHAATACTSDADCRLRWGATCCPDRQENPDTIVAYSNRDELRALTCQARLTQCGPEPEPPTRALAVCNADGHCESILEAPDAGP
jgi:hypothetical protein